MHNLGACGTCTGGVRPSPLFSVPEHFVTSKESPFPPGLNLQPLAAAASRTGHSGQIACRQSHAHRCSPLCPEALTEHRNSQFTIPLCLISSATLARTRRQLCAEWFPRFILLNCCNNLGRRKPRPPSPFWVISGEHLSVHIPIHLLAPQHRLSLAPCFLTLTSLRLHFLMCKLRIMTAPAS